jgi:hypothetical protein
MDAVPLTITFINYIHGVGGVTNVMKLYWKPLGLQHNYINCNYIYEM